MNPSLINQTRLLLPMLLSLTLLACGGASNVKPGGPAPADGTAKPATPPKSGGGYYLDDGPGDNPPANIDSIPDAVPRSEAPLPRANRPYSALGKRYTPQTSYMPYKQRGLASWYGKRYHGQKTSSGEVYDMYGMTGAHTTLPLPSYVRVTNPGNGRSVIVRINDRGPFHSDRLIDLSYAAAYKLRLLENGSGMVEVEAIDTRSEASQKKSNDLILSIPPPPPPPVFVDIPKQAESSPPSVTSNTTTAAPAGQASGNYVQAGVFKQKVNAERLREKLQQQNLTGNVAVENWYNAGVYRVRLGPYASRQDAERAAAKIRQTLGTPAILIRQ